MTEPASVAGSPRCALPDDAKTETLGVCFFDLSRLSEWSSSEEDTKVAAFLQTFYGLSTERIESAGGRVVKFIGDAGLAVFPVDAAEPVIGAICDLCDEVRRCAAELGFDTYLNVNIHVGPVITGTFGAAGRGRYDVLGKTVNIAARLGRRGVTLSAQAFRCLGEEARNRFAKRTPPVTYRFRG
jgi:adenylate cyclase